MSIMDEIMATTPTTTTSKPDVVDELINFYTVNTPTCNSIIVKPVGAFKESPYFIATITGLNVSHQVLDSVFPHLSLKIFSDSINQYDNHYTTINIFYAQLISKDLKNAIREAVNILKEITFCKVDGDFKRPSKKSNQGQLTNILSRLWNMEEDLDCCVCKDATNTKTACGHRICVICWSNINGIAEKDNKKPRCPMCRENIQYKEKHPDSDESDSD